jgi:GMP synthase (glutamine-hydrolysing)
MIRSVRHMRLYSLKAVGVMGDNRVHQRVIALRAVETTDFITAYRFEWEFIGRVSTRIVNEVDGICRVFY